MTKLTKILLIVLLSLSFLLLVVAGFLLVKQKGNLKLPSVVSLGKTNWPGSLIGPQSPDRASQLSPDQILYWTNKYRQDEGLSALTMNDLLIKAAQIKVGDMFQKQYFDHVSPTGTTPSDLVLSVGYNYKVSGENLALGDFKDEKDLVDAWMASPGHRANILNKDYTEIGIATGLDEYQNRTTWMAVQEFGEPAPNCPVPDTSSSTIDAKKTQYETLQSQFDAATQEAKTLADQANAQIDQGNQIYAQTHDTNQAQPYWNEGTKLREQSQIKSGEAEAIQNQMQSLYSEINTLVNNYNTEVESYNQCIK